MFHESVNHHDHSADATRGSCHVVAVDMGYGHERPARALIDLAFGKKIIVANNYKGIPQSDRELWAESRKLYEFVSRLKSLPFVGDALFGVMDSMQRIPSFYPRRDLSEPTLQVREMYRLIRKKGMCRHLVEMLAGFPLPLVTTFFLTAFAAEEHGYPNNIFVVVTDADISRAWAPFEPKKTRIKYLAPTGRVVERLQLYGVPRENIFLTGFPMSKRLIGGPQASVIRHDLRVRLNTLDPQNVFYTRYAHALIPHFGRDFKIKKISRPLTVTFAVGGAGAQKTLGIEIAASVKKLLLKKQLRLLLVAGARKEVKNYFISELRRLGLTRALGNCLDVVYRDTRAAYFSALDRLLRVTDVLWTKPSELSFYAGIGLPIIMAPSVGSQEEFNRLWVTQVGAGITQFDPVYTNEWLFDWLRSGAFARMAWNGFQEAPTHGVYRIEDVVMGRRSEISELPMIV